MSDPSIILVCFAVEEEARFSRQIATGQPQVRILVTGMGRTNAEKTLGAALASDRPKFVLSCGFAGGLHPELTTGTVVFAADREPGLEPALLAAGAQPARFYCADRVAATAEEKRTLRQTTGADAVEMESGAICAVCREQKIPSAIVRVILDAADQDLPLDFNQVLTRDQRIAGGKLALALAKSPAKIGPLVQLRKQSQAAAQTLAEVLAKVLGQIG